MDKPNARELLREAQDWIKGICDIYADELGAGMSNMGEAIMVKIDAYLAAPSESATETVEKIRKIFEDAACYANDDHADYSELLKIARGNAAALIEGLQRSVPRAMLKEIFSNAVNWATSGDPEMIDAIAAKHGVEVD